MGPVKSREEHVYDMCRVPIPPADKPRIQDIHQLPVLFANARPQVGLAHEKRKKVIDKEIAAFFSTGKKLYAVSGEHTKTFPQQRGLTFTTVTSEVLLEGLDGRYYKGTVNESSKVSKDESDETQEGEDQRVIDSDDIIIQPTERDEALEFHPKKDFLQSDQDMYSRSKKCTVMGGDK
ncbi:uncharacterized protein TNCV_4045801 [Trichonephila clavipes]|nr:uncharacterized protein TNCV_4045801 [Trichonephila clavipes]